MEKVCLCVVHRSSLCRAQAVALVDGGEDEGAAEGGVEAEEEVVVGAAGADRIRLVDFLPNPLGLSRHLS